MVYRTLGCISDARIKTACGKATRIWKAIRVQDGLPIENPAVLKDMWVNVELGREGQAMDDIRRCDSSAESQQIFEKSFLTVLHHGDVIIHSANGCDPPHVDMTRLRTKNPLELLHGKSLSDPQIPKPSPDSAPSSDGDSTRGLCGQRVHYRIVFAELCKPLRSEESLAVIFLALSQVCQGKCGTVRNKHYPDLRTSSPKDS